MEQVDGCKIMHARNGREYNYPNCRATALTVVVQKLELYMNFWVVLTMAASVSRFVITKH